MRRFNDKKKINFLTIFLMVDVLLAFTMIRTSSASYTSRIIGTAELDVALYAFKYSGLEDTNDQVLEFDLGNIEPGEEKMYKFSVSNTNEDGKVVFGYISNNGVEDNNEVATLTFKKLVDKTIVTVTGKQSENDFEENSEEIEIGGSILVESLEVTPKEFTLDVGKSYVLKTVVLPDNADDKSLTFKSNDESIAIVDQDGKVTAKKAGTTTIVVSTNDESDIEQIVTVNVNAKALMPTSGRVYIIASAKDNNYVLDTLAGSSAAGANLDLYKANGSEAQAFIFYKLSDGSWQIQNYKGMTISVDGLSKNNKVNILLNEWNNQNNQIFIVRDNGDGTISFISKNSGKALDVSGGTMKNKQNVQQYTDNGTIAQKWVLKDVTSEMNNKYPRTYDGKTTSLSSAVNKNYSLDVIGASKSNRANIQLYKKNGTVAQSFTLRYAGDGTYRIVNNNSNKVVDVEAGKATNKQNVQQYAWNGSKAQRWIMVKNSDNTYTFKSYIDSNYVLDLSGAKADNGRNIYIYQANNTKAQKWIVD